MLFYRDFVYPHLVHSLGDPPPIQRIRRQIIPLAKGEVLEIGVGSGANFIYYDATKVSKLYALEPNPGMITMARRQEQKTKLNVQYIDLPGERIPLDDSSMDTVVSTFTLCTIPDIEKALQGIARVLKPTGRFIFFELGLAPDPDIQKWQKRLEPICRQMFQGLYLIRHIPSFITQAGFQMMQIKSAYLARFPKALSYCWWGTAMKEKAIRSND